MRSIMRLQMEDSEGQVVWAWDVSGPVEELDPLLSHRIESACLTLIPPGIQMTKRKAMAWNPAAAGAAGNHLGRISS